jgi:2-amino-4-hydroxy-6-hydroxymethyldihydropteridine diphosphokinase
MGEERGGAVAFVAVGSNIEREKNILAALGALQENVRVVASSTFYRTEPIGRSGQPRFINGVWRIDTGLPPLDVRRQVLRLVEARLGRLRTQDKFGPRTIDLDLVLYNDVVVRQDDLTLPHPDIARPFVYSPVIELLSQGGADMPDDLRERMKRLLPSGPQSLDLGEPLPEFTRQIREMLHAC